MFIPYDLIFILVAIIYLPKYLFRRKFHRGFLSRLGLLPKNLALNRPIWVHAVSVGEAMAIKGLIEQFRKTYPEKNFVISTVTATGNKIARGIASAGDLVTYLPLDFSFIVTNVVERINPSIFIIVETELWPNLIQCLYRKNIPIVIVNTRISDVSFRGYLSVKFLLRPILTKVNLFCTQTARDAERLMRLGVSGDRIQITGNMKFDAADSLLKNKSADSEKYKSMLGLREDEVLLVAASTHPSEEEAVLDAYKELQKDFPNLRLLIAPRHPERSRDIAKIVAGFGLHSLFISKLAPNGCALNNKPVFILDVIGELVNFYRIANIVFVGGSLVKKGGQNMLEPASLGKPVLFGPHAFNFRDIADLFLSNKAAILVNSKEELMQKISWLLLNPPEAEHMGGNAIQLILKNTGATKRNLDLIKPLLD